jgi:hypothetical protein
VAPIVDALDRRLPKELSRKRLLHPDKYFSWGWDSISIRPERLGTFVDGCARLRFVSMIVDSLHLCVPVL